MSFMYEFPHAHTFDSDLRQIIEMYLVLKELPKTWEEYKKLMDNNFKDLKLFVENYFNNLDVATEINKRIDSMIASGEIAEIFSSAVTNRINVKLYGAMGDNSTDDSFAIEKAIAAAKAEGKPLYFPAGTYLMSSGILLWDNAVIEGCGMGSTILRMARGAAQPVININQYDYNAGITNHTDNVIIRDMTLDTNQTDDDSIGVHALRLVGMNKCLISGVECCNAKGYGIGVQSRRDETRPAYTYTSRFLTIKDCYIHDNGINNSSDGIDIKDCENLIIDNVRAINNGDSGIDIRGNNILISNCHCSRNVTAGLKLRSAVSSGNSLSAIVNNCSLVDNKMSGLVINGEELNSLGLGYVVELNNIYVRDDGTLPNAYPVVIKNPKNLGSTAQMSINNLVVNGVNGIAIQGDSNFRLYLTTDNILFHNKTLATGIGINNEVPNISIKGFKQTRGGVAYNGAASATNCKLILADISGVTRFSGVEPTELYTIN